MRKLALAAALVALTAPAAALADAKGSPRSDALNRPIGQVISDLWQSAFSTPPGFSSTGRHYGWSNGKHWGWFKPKNPHWPHDPVSP
jgi:opacity protein-like surface antigen